MSNILIFGHRNPDTDSICSAISYAKLKEMLGEKVEAVRIGEINKETAYVLTHFNIEPPRLVDHVEDGTKVILVDHNEFQQSVDNIENAVIKEVIDHHRIANFETKEPLYFRAEPVGCTATIILQMFKEHDLHISQDVAGLLLSAIISDSLLFKSPTFTKRDEQAAEELAQIAKVDIEDYGLEMLKAGTDLSDKPISAWLAMDAKEFTMGDHFVEIAQVNTVDPKSLLKQQADIEKAINQTIEQKDLSLFLLVVTNILESESEVLALGQAQSTVEDAFQVKLDNNRALLEGVVSRKKQIVPPLNETFNRP